MPFEGEYLASPFPQTGVTYDVTPDGRRFLMIKDLQSTSATQINVVVSPGGLRLLLARPDAVAFEHRQHEHAAVADLPGPGRLDDGLDRLIGD